LRLRTDQSPTLFRNIGRGILLCAVLYALALVFPETLFRQKMVHGPFTVLAHQPIPSAMEKVLDDATYRLQQSELYDANVKFTIFLTSGPTELNFFAPFSGAYPAVTHKLSSKTFINQSDVAADTVTASASGVRPLHWLIAHESTRVLLLRRFGFFDNVSEPAWKAEGYCEFIANQPEYSVVDGLAKLQRAGPDPPLSLRYFRNGQRVKFLKERQHLSLTEIIHGNFDETALDEAVRRSQE
jgi:hypothetical protein